MVQIKSMGYSRVFSLGNYENEKISVECELQEGQNPTDVYLELKEVVENAHNLRKEFRNYQHALSILREPKLYRIGQVEEAQQTIHEFESKYPNINQVKVHALIEDNAF